MVVEAPEEQEREEALPVDRVRFGVEFSDGRRAERDTPVGGPGDFTIRAFQEGQRVAPDPDSDVVLKFSSGGKSPDSLRESSFLWPLPKGDLRLIDSVRLPMHASQSRHACFEGTSIVLSAKSR